MLPVDVKEMLELYTDKIHCTLWGSGAALDILMKWKVVESPHTYANGAERIIQYVVQKRA